jgi:hypothetical protein
MQIILRNDSQLTASVHETFLALKQEALAVGALIGRVSNATEQADAVNAQTKIRELIVLVEKDRKEVKAPVIELGKKIDACAAKATEDLVKDATRLGSMVSDYAALELQKQRAAEAARQAEASKLERERMAALAQVKSHDEADAVQEFFNAKAQEQAAPVQEFERVANQVVKTDWKITVLNPYDLARFHPACVDIKPRLMEIKSLLNSGVTVKGILAEMVTTSTVRLGAAKAAIDV